MTVRLLVDYFGQPVGSLITRSAAEESQMVTLKMASTDLTGGTTYVAPKPQTQYYDADFTVDASGNTVLAGSSGSIILRGNNPTRTYHPGNNIVNPASFGAGKQIVSMATAAISNVTGSVVRASDQPFATQSGSSIKVSTAGNGLEAFDLTTNAALTASNKWIGFWANSTVPSGTATGDEPYPLCLYFTPNGFVSFAQVAVNIYPGLHYYVVPLPDPIVPSPSWTNVSLPATITTIRFKLNSGGLGGVAATYVDSAGVSINNYAGVGVLWIGDIEVDPPVPKAKFLIDYDDGKWDLVVPGLNTIIDGNGNSKRHSFASYAASYGFPVNAYISTGGLGNNTKNYMDWQAVTRARDEWGVAIGAHSHVHPEQGDIAGAAANAGLRLLGEHGFSLVGAIAQTAGSTGLTYTPTRGNTGIVNDLLLCNETLYKRGFHEATKYLSLPQGGYDIYVNQAINQIGYRVVRGVNGQITHPWAWNTFNANQGGEVLSPQQNVSMSFGLEGGYTEAQIQARVDYIIANGGVGSCYTHTFGSGGAGVQAKYLFDYLAVKKAAGLIDVVSLYEL